MNLEVDEHSISTNRSTPLVNKSLGGNIQRPSLGTRTPNLRSDQVSYLVIFHFFIICDSASFSKMIVGSKQGKALQLKLGFPNGFLTPSKCRGFVWITNVLSKLFLKLFLWNSTSHSELRLSALIYIAKHSKFDSHREIDLFL